MPRLAAALALALATALADPAAAADGTARYHLRLEITWSAETHPEGFPAGGGHMTATVGASHNGRYVLFGDGRTATSGLRVLAENGRAAILRAEFDEAARRGRLGARFVVEGLRQVPGTMEGEFSVSAEHPMVSFATMIAPSPDWFTGLAAIDLRAGDGWRESVALPLWAWDAGTDSGDSHGAANAETQPAQSIRLLAHPAFLTDAGLRTVGRAVLTRIHE